MDSNYDHDDDNDNDSDNDNDDDDDSNMCFPSSRNHYKHTGMKAREDSALPSMLMNTPSLASAS
jgi:hypothetical protein